MEERPETSRLGVLGFSKGSELALVLASRDSRVRAVVAISPSAWVWPGISDGPPETRSSWTWGGRPPPPIPWTVGPEAGAMFAAGPPFLLRLLYQESLDAATTAVREAAAIDVVRINGPLLLVSGDDDGSWPASDMARTMVARMAAAGRSQGVTHLACSDAGHLLFWDFLPATTAGRNPGQIFGGTAAGTARARAASWPEIQRFLHGTLGD